MITYQTLTEALEASRSGNRTITHIHGEGDERHIRFSDLYDRALGILHVLQDHGVVPGNQVILLLDNNEQLIDAFWACLFGKAIPIPVAVGISDEHRHKLFTIFESLEQPRLYTAKRNLDKLAAFGQANELGKVLERLRSRTILIDDIHDISGRGTVHPAGPEDTAFIQYSSGSTSEPKGVVITHRNLLVNINGIVHGAAMTDQDSFLSWMPLTHDMGLIGFHLTPLVLNVDHFLMPTEVFIRRPLLWLQQAGEKRATILCSPNFGYKHFLTLFTAKKSGPMDLDNVRLIFNGAEPISAGL
jgi:acyl-CoA synthetase (AMP-forming)/AMP-acid ligase II